MDGGYYAIKGFAYQFDKFVVEVLSATDENKEYALERIQDIDNDDEVIQVKYKETQKFYPSSVKDPVNQLYEEFIKHPNKKYILFCYFNDLNKHKDGLAKDELAKLLKGNNNFSPKSLDSFFEQFTINFSQDYQSQYLAALKLIEDKMRVNNDEAIYYYSIIIEYAKSLAVNQMDITLRTTTQNKIMEFVTTASKTLFYSSYARYKGIAEYKKFVGKRLTDHQNKQSYCEETILVIDCKSYILRDVLDFAEKMIKNRFLGKSGKKRDTNVKPLTFILSSTDFCKALKRHLITDTEWNYNDGYYEVHFSEKRFLDTPVITAESNQSKKSDGTYARVSYNCRIALKSTQIDYSKLLPKKVFAIGNFTLEDVKPITHNPILIQGLPLLETLTLI